MSNNYQGSEQHKENYKKFRNLQRKGFEKFVEDRRENYLLEYSQHPSSCLFCNSKFEYKNRKKKFCNSSCSAKYNNKNRECKKYKLSKEGLKNIQEAHIKQFPNADRSKKKKEKHERKVKTICVREKICKLVITNCKICEKLFTQRSNGKNPKKTCSKECSVIAKIGGRTYQNGRKYFQKYFNKWIARDVLLESSWERIVAEKLDELNIKWERPKFIRWKDSTGKKRLYFPDFYLNDLDVYLDPKNPFCMKQDEEKMEIVSKNINIEYGAIEKIINFIKNINEGIY